MSADGSVKPMSRLHMPALQWTEARIFLFCTNGIVFLSLLMATLYFHLSFKSAFLVSLVAVGVISTVFGPWFETKAEEMLSGIDRMQVSVDAIGRLMNADSDEQVDALWQETLQGVFKPLRMEHVVDRVPSSRPADYRRVLMVPDLHGGGFCLGRPQRILRRYTWRDAEQVQNLWQIFAQMKSSLRNYAEGQASERRYLAEQIRVELEWPLQRVLQEPEAEPYHALFERARCELADVREALIGEALTVDQLFMVLEVECRLRFAEVGITFSSGEYASTRNVIIDAFRAINLRRIVREAATNVIRHAAARQVNLDMQFQSASHELTISLVDDGIGFDPLADSQGHGMGNMRRRASEMAADIEWVAEKPAGMRMNLRVPLSPEEGA